MPTFEFQSAVVARTADGRVLIALMNGQPRVCVALLHCTEEAGRVLASTLGSMLNEAAPQ